MERRPASFVVMGSLDAPASPIVLSVPHAGRDYPLALRAMLRVPVAALMALEDRHVDAVALAAREGETLLVQRTARAWIDLNRGEDERDPKLEEGATAMRQPALSAKLRSGLGLVPRRTPGAGEIWRRRLAGDEVAARLAGAHRPYHAALAQALAAARARFGVALLLDLHSMPTPPSGARVVIGDRFGRSAAGRFVGRAEDVARGAGHVVALNAPYAGGHVLERHADLRAGVHAIQLELDRGLYLDRTLTEPGAGLAATARLVRGIVDALADEALGGARLAAE